MGLDADEFQRQRERVDEYTDKIVDYLEEQHPDPASKGEIESHFEDDLDGNTERAHFGQALERAAERDDVETLEPIGGNPPTPGFTQYRYSEEN